MFAENKEPGCATYIPYITEKEMLADKDFYRTPWVYSQSSSFKLLNGNWCFHFVSEPSQRPESFYKEDYDVSSWGLFRFLQVGKCKVMTVLFMRM